MCRTCWLLTLSSSDRQRVMTEPITMPVYLCPEHQAEYDKILDSIPEMTMIRATQREGLSFPDYHGSERYDL